MQIQIYLHQRTWNLSLGLVGWFHVWTVMAGDLGMLHVPFDSEYVASWQHDEHTCNVWKKYSSPCIGSLRHSWQSFVLAGCKSWFVSWPNNWYKTGTHLWESEPTSHSSPFCLHSPFHSFYFVIVFLFLLFINGPLHMPGSDNWDGRQ